MRANTTAPTHTAGGPNQGGPDTSNRATTCRTSQTTQFSRNIVEPDRPVTARHGETAGQPAKRVQRGRSGWRHPPHRQGGRTAPGVPPDGKGAVTVNKSRKTTPPGGGRQRMGGGGARNHHPAT